VKEFAVVDGLSRLMAYTEELP